MHVRTFRFALLFAGMVVGLGIASASGDAPSAKSPEAQPAAAGQDDPKGIAFFESKIRPVLVDHCYQCHSAVGQAHESGYAERLIRTIKEEEVYLADYQDFADAQRNITRFLDNVYNVKRIHSALGYLTPREFEEQWRAAQPLPTTTLT